MGVPIELAQGAIRISLGKENNGDEIDYTVDVLQNVISQLRTISSQWAVEGNKRYNLT
jgi:cysteine sulfinate desulfinase/cysteine desulfurase-like protein